METIKEFNNILLKRNEIVGKIESINNPSFDEMRKVISKKFNISEETIDVFSIKGGFGNKEFIIKSHIYDSVESFDSIKKLQETSKKRKEKAKLLKETSKENNQTKENSNN